MAESILSYLIIPALLIAVTLVGRLLAGRLARLPMRSWVERLVFYGLLGVVAISWIGVILACLGLFRWWLLLGALLVWIGWTQWCAGRSRPMDQDRSALNPISARKVPIWADLALIGLLGLASWLYSKPAETLLLTTDASVYTIGGIVLARDGMLSFAPKAIYDFEHAASGSYWEAAVTLPKHAYIDFIEQFSHMETSGPVLSRHSGPFFLWSDLEIGFLSLPKVWVGLCVWLFGPSRAIWHVGLFGVLGLALLYALGSRLSGWVVGLVGVLFLGASLPQFWFARFPMSEVHTQVLLLGSLYLCRLLDEHRESDALGRPLALWSALGLSLITVARFEALLLVIPIAIFFLLGWQSDRVRRRAIDRLWLTALVATALLGTILSLTTSPLYFVTRALTVLSLDAFRVALGVLVALFLGVGVLGLRGRLGSVVAWLARACQSLILAGWLVWGALALWLLLSRPWAYSLPGWLVQYWTRPGLALSVLGASWMIWLGRESAARAGLNAFLGLPLVLLFLYSASPMVAPVHPWAMRRLVPIVMPALAFGASAAIVRGAAWVHARSVGQDVLRRLAWGVYPVAAALVLVQAFTIGQRAWPMLKHREYAGMWSHLEAFAGRFPPGAVLLFDDGEIGWKLTPAMEMVFDLPSFVLQDREAIRSDSPVTNRLIRSALASDRQVFFIVTDDGSDWRPSQWRLEGQFLERFEVPALKYSVGRPPNATDLAQLVFILDVYRVLPVVEGQGRAALQSASVPIGAGSYPYLTTGFYTVESTPDGEVFRWTQGEAEIVLPWPAEDTAEPADFCLNVELSGWRPEGEPAAHLVLKAEGIPLLEQDLDPQSGRTALQISGRDIENANRADLEISLQSTTWNASAFSGGGDERDLGIVLYGLELIPGQTCREQLGGSAP